MKFKLGMLLAVSAVAAFANVQTFVTPVGATNPVSGNPVSASATFTTGTNTITIVLNNLEVNLNDVSQVLTDVDFVLSSGQTAATNLVQAGTQINIGGGGIVTPVAGAPTGWSIDATPPAGSIHLTALGSGQPQDGIIGPPNASGVYSNANGSIAGNGPHNPFVQNTATLTVTVAGVNVDTTITSMFFSFGTVAGQNVPGTPGNPVPEPTSVLLFGSMLGAMGIGLRKRFASR